MKKTSIFLLSGVFAFCIFFICRVAFQIITTRECNYSSILGNERKYFNLFDSSAIQKLHCTGYKFGNGTDFIYVYNYVDKYRYIIWEISGLNSIQLNELNINKNIVINKVKISPSSIYDFRYGPSISLRSKICLPTINRIEINFGLNSEYISRIDSSDYTIITGKIVDLGIANEFGEYQILMNYKYYPVLTDIVFYKREGSAYLIIVNANDGISDVSEAVKLLNLR